MSDAQQAEKPASPERPPAPAPRPNPDLSNEAQKSQKQGETRGPKR
jgi:hypothetical protein